MAYSPGESGNKNGRPKGSLSAVNRLIKQALPDVLASVIEQARSGDLQACALVLARGVPPLRATSPVTVIATAHQLEGMTPAGRAEVVTDAVMCGRLSADIGAQILQGIQSACAIREATELLERVEELEKHAEARGGR